MAGFHIGNGQEAFDAEAFVIMRGIHFLASRRMSGQDSQAAMIRIQSDAPGPW